MNDRNKKTMTLWLCSLCIIINHLSASQISQDAERKLSVIVDKASIYLEPNASSPVIGYVLRGTPLKSYAGDGEWYRIMIPAGQEMISAIGYISAKDVKVLEEQALGAPDFWSVSGAQYKGAGVDIIFTAGWTHFGGGTVTDGVGGLYDEWKAMIAAKGYPISDIVHRPFRTAIDASVDVAFRLSSRLAVGIGGGYFNARNFDSFGLMDGIIYHPANCTPILQAFIIRPAVYWTLPLNEVLSLRLDGGPAIFLSNFEYNRNYATSLADESFHIRAHGTAFGVQGGAALEVRLNERVGLLFRAMVRIARISSMEGDEKFESVVNSLDNSTPQYGGTLVVERRGVYSVLTVHPDTGITDAQTARFDFSGFSLSFGLKIRI
jgi:hypothetical protein